MSYSVKVYNGVFKLTRYSLKVCQIGLRLQMSHCQPNRQNPTAKVRRSRSVVIFMTTLPSVLGDRAGQTLRRPAPVPCGGAGRVCRVWGGTASLCSSGLTVFPKSRSGLHPSRPRPFPVVSPVVPLSRLIFVPKLSFRVAEVLVGAEGVLYQSFR